MPDVLSKRDEQRLMDSVKQAIRLTNDGKDPDAAIAKVAAAEGYNTDFVERMVNFFNTSRTLAHFKEASADSRGADFPLADARKVIQNMLPARTDNVEAGAGELGKSASLMRLPQYSNSMIKAAAAGEKSVLQSLYAETAPAPIERDGTEIVSRVCNLRRDGVIKIANARTALSEAIDRRNTQFGKVAEYFRTPGHRPFAEVDATMKSSYGELGRRVMDATWEALGPFQKREKRAEPAEPMMVFPECDPYIDLINICKSTKLFCSCIMRIILS